MKLKVSYKPLEITLIKRNKMKKDLKRDLSISGSTLAKMSKSDFVAMSVIHKICEYLECQIQDVVEFVEDRDN
ncbi:helix-turn-helix domain-containing protein [Bacillus atrophaeus]|nr:helix-turn-helix domain-containing protein [Bacillus atrophaeus]MCY7948055.1 helix-turn-helix domain-containing protein [Bacillus atrophaeus]MCY8098378.1 helix-turn-helix domain-containing protein [Bacillus atrophaeus]MCY9169923.1 helix-turn-helix domain-containing protein [Bacillus atrophaeus]MEC0740648.1 helix-turn-helix domain-containing protein [Bacillus atrophaeus]MEC0747088.1 helix-turn-helix domain-containing protein [Bacillus atrophaeus]